MKKLWFLLALLIACLPVLAACNLGGGHQETDGEGTEIQTPAETGTSEPEADPESSTEAPTSDEETKVPADTDVGEETENETMHTHAWSEWNTAKEATCTEAGLKERTCACGKKETQSVDALGHNFVDQACTRCGKRPSEGLTFTSKGDGTCEDTDVVIPDVSPAGDSVTSIGGGRSLSAAA